MFTKRALNELLSAFQNDLLVNGFPPEAMILYGSYASGKVHHYSDVDVAVWSKEFSGNGFEDFEKIRHVLRNYRKIHARFYPSDADENNFDPFVAEIKRTGVIIYEQEKKQR